MKTRVLIILTSLLCLAVAPAVLAGPTIPISAIASSILAQQATGADTTQQTTTSKETKDSKDTGEATTTTTTKTTTTVWYTDPVWLVVGGLVALLVIVLLVAGLRGDGHTTVITR